MKTQIDFNFILNDLTETVLGKGSSNRKRLVNIAVSMLPKEDLYELVRSVAYDVFNLSQQLVPVKTGYLKSTGYIKSTSDGWEIGYTAPYAVFVHEIIDTFHAPPTQSKFLQDSLNRVMFTLVATYGEQNIPDFDVRLDMSVEEGVKLFIFPTSESSKGMTWRRFLGL